MRTTATNRSIVPRGIRVAPIPAAILAWGLVSAPQAVAENDNIPLRLVESWPLETVLDHPEIPDAPDVWLSLIRGAAESIDFAEFYASDDPAGGGRLRAVIEAVIDAARRGVQIRFLSEESFYKTYPEIIDRFSRIPGITVRRLDSAAFDGGVHHAKYFMVDGKTVFLGSQNFDWRALEHIQELGAIITDPGFVREIRKVYEIDWEIAGRVRPGEWAAGAAKSIVDSLLAGRISTSEYTPSEKSVTHSDSSGWWLRPAFSPERRIPDRSLWDEPQIVDLIDSARESVRVQLLTYRPVDSDRDYYAVLDNALRRAAARGAEVQLLLADWCKRESTIPYLKSLAAFPGIEVRLMTIPPWTGGFIPFARICHAKYMVADGDCFWVGTSNWEKGYFHAGRNVGVVGGGGGIGEQLTRFFQTGWDSPYAETVRPEIDYEPPRIAE